MKKRAFARKAVKVMGIEGWNITLLCILSWSEEISSLRVLYNTQADSRRPTCILCLIKLIVSIP